MNTKPSVTIQLPTEPSYWGSTATESDVVRILDNLESMIRGEFEKRAELQFERTTAPRGNGVHSEDNVLAGQIHWWISLYWTAAL